MTHDYHKPIKIYDFFIGIARNGKLMVKRYTYINDQYCQNNGYYSDYPLYAFDIETIGL